MFRVRFFGIEEEFPATVRDLAYLRSKGLLSLTTFYRLMRNYGITRTRALIIQGKVERKEYVVIDEKGTEFEPDEIHDKLATRVYEFAWMLKLKYTKRKHHQIHLEVTVEGEIEKHEVFPEPTSVDIMNELKDRLEQAFENYMINYWQIAVNKLKLSGELDDYTSEIAEFEEVREYYKEIDAGLEGSVTDVSFFIKRYEEVPWRQSRYYAESFEPYATLAVKELSEWILDTEMDFLRKEIETASKEVKTEVRKVRFDVLVTRIKEAKTVQDVKLIEKDLEDLSSKGEITEEEYDELIKMLREKSEEVFDKIVKGWCNKISRSRTEGELNTVMKRIMDTWTWKNYLFEPYREKVLECERRKRNELIKEAVKRKEITRERALKRVESYFRRRKEEIMRTTRSVRDLRRLIARVRRSALSEEKKEELIKLIEDNVEKVQKENCEKAWETVKTETDITKLRNLYYTIGNNRQNYEPCYDEVRKAIKSKIQKLRRESYRRRADEIIEEFKEAETFDRIAMVNRECSNILMLPVTVQYRVFKELIELAENRSELSAIFNCLKDSPIWTEPKYSKWKSRLYKMIEEKRL